MESKPFWGLVLPPSLSDPPVRKNSQCHAEQRFLLTNTEGFAAHLIEVPELGMSVPKHALITLRESIISFPDRELAVLYLDVAKVCASQYKSKRKGSDVYAVSGSVSRP